jgi:Fe-S-cluster containining protein
VPRRDFVAESLALMQTFYERESKQASEPKATSRLEPFGYVCQRCARCCHHKGIQVNPYEIARLARKLGQTTTEFRMAWTQDSARAMLKRTDAGACEFLGASGCTVHSDRPLVCRLYPLGRHVLADGTEWFSHLEPHPQSAGHVSADNTIAEYLEKQGAQPFIVAADEYFYWLCAASDCLVEEGSSTHSDQSSQDNPAVSELLDMDVAITRHCNSIGIVEPNDLDDRMKMHLRILYQHLNQRSATS